MLVGATAACSPVPPRSLERQTGGPPATEVMAASSEQGAADVTPARELTPPRRPGAEALAAAVPGPVQSGTLLLAFHVEAIESYRALFSAEGVPAVDEGAGYVTLAIRVDEAGRATIASRLPFVAVPPSPASPASSGGSSFRLIDEASYREDHTPSRGFNDDPPHFYASTALVSAERPAALRKAVAAEIAAQKKARAWGESRAETLLFATPLAMCTFQSDSEWMGGALAFRGWDRTELVSLTGATLEARAAAYVPDETLRGFAREALVARDETPDADVDLDAEVDLFFRKVVFRRDTSACLGRAGGATVLLGSVVLPGNSARSYAWLHPLGPAPDTLATREETVDLAIVRGVFPDARDAFVAPGRSSLVVLRETRLASFAGADRVVDLGIELPADARVVLAEWAMEGDGERWVRELQELAR